MNWENRGLYMSPDTYPHDAVNIDRIPWQGKCLMARWTENFDCEEETQFWWVIKDTPFDLEKLKAKRRYEINKGNKNFYVKVIQVKEYAEDLYDVYLDSIHGYKNPIVESREQFMERIEVWDNCADSGECSVFGVFARGDNKLCGFADVWQRGKYLPISSMKTRVTREKENVNFALIYGIVEHYRQDILNGCYLSDGARNVVHETAFQDFLIKYFGFRKAYCQLKIQYRGVIKYVVMFLFPFRKFIRKSKNPYLQKVYFMLKMHAWSRELEE